MSLLDEAAADLQAILGDATRGFAVPITVTDPANNTAVINGLQTDVALTIDPETGVAVTGRRASVVLPIAALTAAGLGEPRGVADSDRKPWLVRFTAPTGGEQLFKVTEALPDKLGCVVCLLEVYKP